MFIAELDDTTLNNSLFPGVEFKTLVSFPDDRGFFRELIRNNDEFFAAQFGQWSHSKMGYNTVKAWHFHHRQTDWWYCPMGQIHTALIDNRTESPTFGNKLEFYLGDSGLSSEILSAIVKIPPGVLHGCRVISPEAHLFYITSHVYDPNDEGRIPFNSPNVDHCWAEDEAGLIISANDRKEITPPYERKPIS